MRRLLGDVVHVNRCLIGKMWLLAAAIALSGCARAPGIEQPAIVEHPSANQDGRVRFLVLHFTDENFERSLDLLTNRHENPVSAHYLVSRDGDLSRPSTVLLPGEYGRSGPAVLRLVDESQRAWHAGPSRWQGHESLNGESIGVEIVYESHCQGERMSGASPWDVDATCAYPPYPADQIDAVIELAHGILKRHPEIDAARVVGHSDIQPENKTDPGPRFPWRQLAAAGIGAWPEDADVEYFRAQFDARRKAAETAGDNPDLPTAVLPLKLVQQALAAYGYGLDASGVDDLRTREVLAAFQSHFLPDRRSGKVDTDTVATLFALLAKYRPGELRTLRERASGIPESPRDAARR